MLVGTGFFIGSTVSGQTKPNFTGSWEYVARENGGNRVNAVNKETHIFVHQEQKLKIRMLLETSSGPATSEIQYTTDGKAGEVGYIQRANGARDKVDGSAHWEGDRLIYEQRVHDSAKGTIFHIIRSLKLEKDGMSMMADEVFW